MTRSEALDLLHAYTASEGLRKHAYAVEAAMRAYARRFGADEERWGLTGLLPDFDYERSPGAPSRARGGAKSLREKGGEEEIIRATLPPAEWDEIPRDTPLKKTLFAVDEL